MPNYNQDLTSVSCKCHELFIISRMLLMFLSLPQVMLVLCLFRLGNHLNARTTAKLLRSNDICEGFKIVITHKNKSFNSNHISNSVSQQLLREKYKEKKMQQKRMCTICKSQRFVICYSFIFIKVGKTFLLHYHISLQKIGEINGRVS